jgi:hypothetical protein
MIINYKYLSDKHVSSKIIDDFRNVFGAANITLTEELAAEHVQDFYNSYFNWDWVAKNLLTEDNYLVYYEDWFNSYSTYELIRDEALFDYNHVKNNVEEELPAWRKYHKITVDAWQVHLEFINKLFVRIFNEQEEEKSRADLCLHTSVGFTI